MKENNLSLPTYSKIVGLHFALLFLFVHLFFYLITGKFPEWITQFNQWDVGWYLDIMQHGYVFDANQQNNTAFYPLFPYFWKISHLNLWSMALVNLGIFIFSYWLLIKAFKPSVKTIYLYLAIPVLFYYTVPYTESFFFLFCTLLFIGLQKKNLTLTLAGIFFASLTRSSSIMFLPVLAGMMVLSFKKENLRFIFTFLLPCLLAIFMATALVECIQHYQTGVWFTSFKSQVHWWHYLREPELPFVTWGDSIVLKLDGTAALIAFICIGQLIFWLYKKFIRPPFEEQPLPVYFAFLYMAGLTSSMILYQGGGLASLNRYIFCTPCFFIFLFHYESVKPDKKLLIAAFILLLFYWLLFGSYQHIKHLLAFTGLSIFLLATWYFCFTSENKKFFFGFYAFLTLLQAYWFAMFLSGRWVS